MYQYDPDHLLAEQTLIPLRLTTPIFHGAALLQTCTVLEQPPVLGSNVHHRPRDAAVNTRLLVPLWLARALYRRGASQLEIPPVYRSEVTRLLRSQDAALRREDPITEYYYEVGASVAGMLPREEGQQLLRDVMGVYQQRYCSVVRSAVGGESSKRFRCVREQQLSEHTAKRARL